MEADQLATPEGLEHVLAVVRAAAREAATLVSGGFRHHPTVEHKGPIDLVTEYDRASEALLRDRLGKAFPTIAIVGEEAADDDAAAAAATQPPAAAFYVDPIDGTTNFVHGHPFWCISIGLVVAGVPVLGVVLAPPLGLELFGYTATKTGERRAVRRSVANELLQQTTTREEDCRVSTMSRFEESMLATGFPYDRRTSADNNFDAFTWIKRRCLAVRRCGSAALDLCLVADGTYDGYWERKLRPWDIAAGIAIVLAAGGKVTDFEGNTLPFDILKGRVVATNGLIHDALVRELRSSESS